MSMWRLQIRHSSGWPSLALASIVASAIGAGVAAPTAHATGANRLAPAATALVDVVYADEPEWPAENCAEVIVYVVRGSGEDPQSGDAVKPFDPRNPAAGYGATWDAFDPIDPSTGGSSIDAGVELDLEADGNQRWTPGPRSCTTWSRKCTGESAVN